jgi:ATP-dependent Lhr-like helicase
MHVLAHQLLALTLQEGGVSRHRVLPWVQAAFPFSGIEERAFQELVDFMIARDILYEADGVLSLGTGGEQLYGRKNFFELYAVFSAPPVLRVVHGKDEIGHIQAQFVSLHDPTAGPLSFRLSGRAWEVVQIEWNKGLLRVRPADHGRVPAWLGQPSLLSEPLCRMMRTVLAQPGPEEDWLTPAAAHVLHHLRTSYVDLLAEAPAPLEDTPEGVQWHTFAGGAINRLLAAGLELVTAKKWQAGNLSLRCRDLPLSTVREALVRLPQLDWPQLAATAAHHLLRGPLSKFQPCLPPAMEDHLLASRLLDLPGTLRLLQQLISTQKDT